MYVCYICTPQHTTEVKGVRYHLAVEWEVCGESDLCIHVYAVSERSHHWSFLLPPISQVTSVVLNILPVAYLLATKITESFKHITVLTNWNGFHSAMVSKPNNPQVGWSPTSNRSENTRYNVMQLIAWWSLLPTDTQASHPVHAGQ